MFVRRDGCAEAPFPSASAKPAQGYSELIPAKAGCHVVGANYPPIPRARQPSGLFGGRNRFNDRGQNAEFLR